MNKLAKLRRCELTVSVIYKMPIHDCFKKIVYFMPFESVNINKYTWQGQRGLTGREYADFMKKEKLFLQGSDLENRVYLQFDLTFTNLATQRLVINQTKVSLNIREAPF